MRRIVLVLIILAVLGLIAGGGWWYLHRNSGASLLDRAQLALRAQKYGRAIELARDYTAKNPEDWRGYYVQAQAHTATGRYEVARRLLDDAAEIAPDEADIVLLRSDTFAYPARETLRKLLRGDPGLTLDAIRRAVEELKGARHVLEAAYPPGQERPLAVDEALGLVLNNLGKAGDGISDRLSDKADTLEAAKQKDKAQEARAEAKQVKGDARRRYREAARLLTEAVTKAARGKGKEKGVLPRRATNVLAEVCLQHDYEQMVQALSDLVFKTKDGMALSTLVIESRAPPLAGVTELIKYRLLQTAFPRGSTGYMKVVRKACEQLDGLLERFGDHAEALSVRLARADLAMELGELDRAEALCNTILENLPQQRDARLLLARVAMARGDTAEAEERLLALKTDWANWPPAHIYYALVALDIGNRERAREALRSVTEETVQGRPQSLREKRLATHVTQARLILAESLLMDNLAEQALNEIQHVLDAETVPVRAYYLYLWSAVCAEQAGLAEEPLAKGLEQHHSDAAFMRIVSYPEFLEAATPTEASEKKRKQRQADAYETVKAAAQTALAKNPGNPNALQLRVQSALATGEDHGASLAALRKAAKDYPDNRAVQAAVADCFAALGKLEEAKQATERVAAGVPEDLREQLLAARGRLKLGKTAEAESVLHKAIAAHPQSHGARALLADVYLHTRRPMQAVEQLREAVSLAPGHAPYELKLARALRNTGLMDEANEHVQAVLSRDPDNADALLLANQIRVLTGEAPETEGVLETRLTGRSGRPLAQAYLSRGNPEKCIEICRDILKDNPGDVDTRELLARALLTTGDRAGAVEQLSEALKAAPDHLPFYQAIALVVGAEQDVAKVEATLGAVPGARPDLVNLASATLLERQRQYEAAAEAYARVVDGADTKDNYREIARISKGRCLAAAGHVDLAILELNRVPADHPMHMNATFDKALLLAASGKRDEAGKALEEVRQTAVAKENMMALARVGDVYLRMNLPDDALAVADEAADIAPDNPRPLLLRGAAMAHLGRTDETIQCLRQAVALQPGNLQLHRQLALTLETANRPLEALQALAVLEKQGRTGEATALTEKSRMLLRWGLQKQAVETLMVLADREQTEAPHLRLLLGSALANLGRKDQARKQLSAVPVHSQLYVAARQLLAQLADTDEEKLAILAQTEKAHPSPALAAQRITILRQADRPADAVKALRTHMADLGENAVPSVDMALTGILALLQNGEEAQAADLAVQVARRAPRSQMGKVATVLALRSEPANVPDLLPPPDRAGPADALLGLCRAALAGDETKPWAQRLAAIRQAAAQADRPQPLSASRSVLAAVAVGDLAGADELLTESGATGDAEPPAARELIQAARHDPAVRKEAAAILASSIAVDLRLTEFGWRWAMDILRRRPASQWAASVAARGAADADALREVVDILKPDDCITARTLRMSLLRLEGKFDAAAQMARELAEADKENPGLVMAQATALEKAGHLKDALALYEQAWQMAQDSTAANNAAYLSSVLYPEDKERLQKAMQWAQAAVKGAPHVGAFRDTRGWIAYLLGDYEEARRELWQAVRRIPNAPEIHYHLGMAEQKTGRPMLARWHLEAAVDLTEAAKADDRNLTEAETEAGRLAKAALAELEGSQTP